MSLNKKMGDAHEAHLCEVFGVRQTRGSGNQWRDQMDARSHRMDEAVAFAWDGKSTRAASTTIKKADLDKAFEQSAGERPILAIRFYGNDRLTIFEDWDLLREDDLLELIERSRRLSEVQAAIKAAANGVSVAEIFPDETQYEDDGGTIAAFMRGLEKLAA